LKTEGWKEGKGSRTHREKTHSAEKPKLGSRYTTSSKERGKEESGNVMREVGTLPTCLPEKPRFGASGKRFAGRPLGRELQSGWETIYNVLENKINPGALN